jgi:hypothetical protein
LRLKWTTNGSRWEISKIRSALARHLGSFRADHWSLGSFGAARISGSFGAMRISGSFGAARISGSFGAGRRSSIEAMEDQGVGGGWARSIEK